MICLQQTGAGSELVLRPDLGLTKSLPVKENALYNLTSWYMILGQVKGLAVN